MSTVNILFSLLGGAALAFLAFFVFYRIFNWRGSRAALITAALMLFLYIPLALAFWPGLDVFAIHFAIYSMIPYGLGIITGSREDVKARLRLRLSREEKAKKAWHWGPLTLVGFFIILAIVDSIIITFATKGLDGTLALWVLPQSASKETGKATFSHFTGTVSHDYQDEEEQYNAYVQRIKEQRIRGWQVKGGWQPKVVAGETSAFTITVNDKQNQPLQGAKVEIDFYRAADMAADVSYTLPETQSGHYSMPISLALPGCWQSRIVVSLGDVQHEMQGNTDVAERVNGEVIDRHCLDDDRG